MKRNGETKDNMSISDNAPSVYYPIVCEEKPENEVCRIEEEKS